MNILAVIPARAGSKGIPNKNIRIIGGKPLVYYSIHNALSSRYITDVIVTTDSPEVKIIANQIGAKCKWRDASLCGDAVTLDAVIADAIPKDKHWDYIVTMQPTSPTLTVETLDKAIAYASTVAMAAPLWEYKGIKNKLLKKFVTTATTEDIKTSFSIFKGINIWILVNTLNGIINIIGVNIFIVKFAGIKFSPLNNKTIAGDNINIPKQHGIDSIKI